MPDPFANIPAVDDAILAGLPGVDAFDFFEVDDVPGFDQAENPEVNVNARLRSDRAIIRTQRRRLFVDYRPNPDALLHLNQMPRDRETLHGVICGKYDAWDMVPALIERVGRNISELYVATLSYGKKNAEELLGLIDDGRIKRVTLLVSYYFKAQNRPLYDALVPGLLSRGHRVLAMRTHAKIMLIKFSRGGSYVWEGSANLRSCKNLEQFALTRDRKLYNFHREWIEGELFAAREAA